MKKLFAIVIAAMLLLFTVSCGFVSMEGEEAEINYDTVKMQANLERLRNEDGIYVELLITSYESGETPVTGTMAYGETADMFYFKGEGSEIYYDFSDDAKTVIYEKNEDGVWVRSEIIYEESGMTREQMESQCELQASAIFTYLDMYEQFNGQRMKKTAVQIAGRTCDEFNISVGALGYGVSYVFAVDPETGMCLKWQMSASAITEGAASASFTCNKFETPYTIQLPTDYVDAEHGGYQENTQGVDVEDILSGNTSVIYGQLSDEEKQLLISEAWEDGVSISFASDGTMTAVDTDGSLYIQSPDGSWTFKDSDGNEVHLDSGEWTSNEFTSLIPEPTAGTALRTVVDGNTCTVMMSWTAAQAQSYAAAVMAAGFNNNTEEINVMGIYSFYGENASGVSVSVSFTEDVSVIVIEK